MNKPHNIHSPDDWYLDGSPSFIKGKVACLSLESGQGLHTLLSSPYAQVGPYLLEQELILGVGAQGDGQVEGGQEHPAEYRSPHAHGQERVDGIDEKHSPPDALGSSFSCSAK